MDFFYGKFFQRALQTLRVQQVLGLDQVQFLEGDPFFKTLWHMIDSAKHYAFVCTYAMDSSIAAKITVNKLRQASQRGVKTLLFVDDLQQNCDPHQIKKYQESGGCFKSLNPQWNSFWPPTLFRKIFVTQEIFRRHHQKLALADNKLLLGSSNLEADYGGFSYGTLKFKDLNILVQNSCLKQARRYIESVAEQYQINISKSCTNSQLFENLNQLFQQNPFRNISLLANVQPSNKSIENTLTADIQSSKRSLVILQPYYYPMKAFQKLVLDAHNRGVKVQIITTARRDQPVYRKMTNSILLDKLIRQGIKVYQYDSRVLHAKGYIIDGRVLSLGSFNNDRWSWRINNQLNLRIEQENVERHLQNFLGEVRKECSLVPSLKEQCLQKLRVTQIRMWSTFLMLSQFFSVKQNKIQAFKDVIVGDQIQ